MKRLLTTLACMLTLGGLVGTFSPAATATPTVTPVISHVVVIMMENHSYSQVIGPAPYITSLSKTYGQATDYVNILHPSAPNYMAITGGTNAGITNDCLPSSSCGSNGASIFSQLGTSWKAYNESMPSACDKANAGTYAPKHNPAVYYRTLTTCKTNDVALPSTPSFATSLTFVTPNLCHDMHDCSVATGDSWLKTFVPKVLNSAEYKAGNTALFIVWDENSGSGTIPFVVVSPYTHAVKYTGKIDHYNTLRTIQTLLGNKPCLANSCSRSSFASAFGL